MSGKRKESWQQRNIRILNLLVELGFAHEVNHDPVLGSTEITWTPAGKDLAKQIKAIHDSVIAGRGKRGKRDGELLMNILLANAEAMDGEAAFQE